MKERILTILSEKSFINDLSSVVKKKKYLIPDWSLFFFLLNNFLSEIQNSNENVQEFSRGAPEKKRMLRLQKMLPLYTKNQGYNARKVSCSCVYSAYILKPVLSGRNL